MSDLQNMLNWSLYGIDGPNYKPVNGQFSAATTAEVKSFQSSNALSQTGDVNKSTWQKLCAGGANSSNTWKAAAKDAGCKA